MNESHLENCHLQQHSQTLTPTLPINTHNYKPPPPHPTPPLRMNSPRKRLQIFKGYNPRLANSDLQDEETVIINPRKYTSSSGQLQEDPLQKYQRQPFQELNSGFHEGRKDRDSTKTNRKHIFPKASFSPKQTQNQQLSKSNSQDSLIPTQRLRQNIDNVLSCSNFQQIDRPTLLQTRSQISPIKFAYSSVQRENTLEKKNPLPQSQIKFDQKQPTLASLVSNPAIISPKKITFTYQPTSAQGQPPCDQKQVLVHRIPKYQSLSQVRTAMTNYLEVPQFQAFESSSSNSQLKEQKNNPAGSKIKKNIFLSNERSVGRKISQGESWGNRIRTELMGERQKETEKPRKDNACKTALLNCKESIIVGSKLNRNNLKINESFSNVSDNQSSKRYYDEDFQFLPQLKKISYNNIDISRDQSFNDQHEEQFKTNQLFGEFHPHGSDLEPNSPAKILRSTCYKFEKPKAAVEEPILEQLSSQIKEQKKGSGSFGKQKLLPMILIVLASMLLLIQLAI